MPGSRKTTCCAGEICRSRLRRLSVALLVLIAMSGSAARAYDGHPGGPEGVYRVTLRKVEIFLARYSGQPDRPLQRADRSEIQRISRAGLYVVTRIGALDQTGQTTVIGPLRMSFNRSETRPRGIAAVGGRLVYEEHDCAPAAPVIAQANATLVESSRLRASAAATAATFAAPVYGPSYNGPRSGRLETVMNPVSNDGVALAGGQDTLALPAPGSRLPPSNDVVTHLSGNLAPGGRSSTVDVVTHYVFDYSFTPDGKPCPVLSTGDPFVSVTFSDPHQPDAIDASPVGVSGRYDETGSQPARYEVTLERVRIVLVRFNQHPDRRTQRRESAEIDALERTRLLLWTRVTAAGHGTEYLEPGVYPLHFANPRSWKPSATITLAVRGTYSHLDRTPAEAVTAAARAWLIPATRFFDTAGAAVDGPFPDDPLANGSPRALLSLPMATATLAPQSNDGLLDDLTVHLRHGWLTGTNTEDIVVHYVFRYRYVPGERRCGLSPDAFALAPGPSICSWESPGPPSDPPGAHGYMVQTTSSPIDGFAIVPYDTNPDDPPAPATPLHANPPGLSCAVRDLPAPIGLAAYSCLGRVNPWENVSGVVSWAPPKSAPGSYFIAYVTTDNGASWSPAGTLSPYYTVPQRH